MHGIVQILTGTERKTSVSKLNPLNMETEHVKPSYRSVNDKVSFSIFFLADKRRSE